MVDRVKLLDWALQNSDLNTKQKNTINTNVEKALDEALSGVALSAIAEEVNKNDLALYLMDSAPAKTLNAISQLWEPQRGRLDAEQKSELKHDLVALLRGQRTPYSKLTISLSDARDFTGARKEELKHSISQIAPASDLSALIKQWDPDLPKKPTKRGEQIAHLMALVSGDIGPHPSKKLDLSQFKELARTSGKSPIQQINEREPIATLKVRIKKWDKYLQPQPATKTEIISHIEKLVKGSVDPVAKPPTKRKQRKS